MQTKTPTNLPEVAKKLDEYIVSVIGAEKINGFEKAFQMSTAIGKLKEILTPEYMNPIMQLQGTRLGFRTDKDKTGGYPMAVVQTCLIEAVLMGLQPTNNQFNIIAGNMYPTKEGCGALLAKFPGLRYSIITGLPKVNQERTSCAFEVEIKWTLPGKTEEAIKIPIPIKIDQYASVDSMVGKATRKARAWLLSRITGTEITDGEIEDTNATVVETKLQKTKEEQELERVNKLLELCQDEDQVDVLALPEQFKYLADARKKELNAKK